MAIQPVPRLRSNGKFNPEYIREKLRTDDSWLARGLVCIYRYQTADEKISEDTKWQNGVGFNGADGEFLTSVAKSVIKYAVQMPGQRPQYKLTDKQKPHVRKAMLKYAGQLARVADGAQSKSP